MPTDGVATLGTQQALGTAIWVFIALGVLLTISATVRAWAGFKAWRRERDERYRRLLDEGGR